MKQLASTYTISGSAVTLTGVNVPLSQILLVSDATTGSVLYSMAGPAASSYTQATNSVITLATAPGASDKLTIYYDDGVAPANAPTSVSVSNFPSTQPVSGTITANTGLTQPLTDTQLRASAVPVSAASLPLPSGAAIEGGNLASIATEALAIDAKLPALSSGRVPVEANNAASQVYNYTITGALANNTVIIGPVDCSLFRELSVHTISVGTGATSPIIQISNDGTNWVNIYVTNTAGNISGTLSNGSISAVALWNAKQFRIVSQGTQTAGTTTLVAYASQQATPKLYQTVTVSGGTLSSQPSVSNNIGYSLYHTLVSAASTNATSVKASSGSIGTLILTNSSATWAYFKLVNKTSAPTVGTDTAVINIGVAPNSTLDCSTSFAGLRMATGLAYYVSGGSSLTDNTALATAGTFLVNMSYV